jgi:hypothetical protein
MKLWRVHAAGLVLALVWGGVVNAAPVGLYQFKVTELACTQQLPQSDAECQRERDFFSRQLEAISFVAPLIDGPKAFGLNLNTQIDAAGLVSPVVAGVNGITAMNLSAWGVPLNLELGLCLVAFRCELEAAFFTDGGPLTGLFRLGTTNDDIFMKTDAAFLWSGHITSDGPFMTSGDNRPTFSGYWRVVPEPGTLVLLLVPLLYLAAMRTRMGKLRG